jgi:hypothetical protein
MGIWFGARVEETGDLDGFLSQVFQITDNVLGFPDERIRKLKVFIEGRCELYSLYARDMSHAWYTIFFPSGRNWFKKSTQ